MPRARYSLGATVCPEDPIWRSMGNQPESQIGREAAKSPPKASASCLAISIFFCSLMPRPTETMISACVRSTACLASLKNSWGLLRISPSAMSTCTDITGEGRCSSQLALKHLTGENEFAVFVFETDAIADHRPPHSRSQFRNKVAHLIGVRHQHKLRLFGGEHLFERGGEGVRRVRLELRRFDGVDLCHLLRCAFGGDGGSAGPNHGGL